MPLSIELLDFQMIVELFQRRVCLIACQLALFIQIGDVLAYNSLLLDHLLAYPALSEVLTFDELSDHVLVFIAN